MEAWFQYCYAPILHKEELPPNKPLLPPEFKFIFWKDGDFGLCFEQLVVISLSYVILAIVSGVYASLKHSTFKRRRPVTGLAIRSLITLCLLVNSLIGFTGSFWLVPARPYSVLLSQCIEVFAWLIHLIALFVLSRSPFHSGFGPLPLNLAWALTMLSSIVHFRTVIRYINHNSIYAYFNLTNYNDGYLSLFPQVVCYIQFGLQLLYLFLIPLPAKTATIAETYVGHKPLGIGSTQFQEQNSLLNGPKHRVITSDAIQDYGSFRLQPPPSLRRISSEDNANCFSFLSFWWLQSLMKKGSVGLLQKPEDLPLLPRKITTAQIRERFQSILHHLSRRISSVPNEQTLRSLDRLSQYSNSQSNMTPQFDPLIDSSSPLTHNEEPPSLSTPPSPQQRRPVSLIYALNKAFGWHYYPLGLIKLFNDCLGFGGPLLLHQLVAFMENRNEPISHGYYYALGLFLSTLLTAVLNSHFTYQVNKVGLKVRAAIVTEVFRKSLSVNSVEMSKFSTGEVVNFMSTDTDRIVNFCPSFHQFWSLPFQIAVSLYLLYRQVGLAFLAGLAFCILLIPINRWLAKKIGQLSTAMMSQKDQRVKLMTEILTGIRVIKFYAWEQNFASRVNQIRAKELSSLKGRKYLDALCVYFWATTPVLISILTFTTYVAMGHKLTAAKVFTSLALFNMLISPLNAFPWVLNGLVEAWVSLKRVQAFLSLLELDPNEYYMIYGSYQTPLGDNGNELINVADGCFTWKREDSDDVENRNSKVKEENIENKEDEVRTDEEYECVEWLLNGLNLTVRKGEFVGVVGKVGAGKSSLLAAVTAEMRKKSGQVFVADLHDGFAIAIQEPWIQHATVRENILFGLSYDVDKYSAVIYACALEPDLQILPAGDMTEVGENGVTLSGGQKARLALARAVYQDKEIYLLDDPLSAVDAHVAAHLYTHCIMGLLRRKTRILCTHHTRFLQEADCVIVLNEGQTSIIGSPTTVLPLVEGKTKRDNKKHEQAELNNSQWSQPSLPLNEEDEKCDDDGVLVKEEEKEEGVVKFSVYLAYWAAVGILLAPAIFLALFLMQASRNINDWWLSYWITKTHNGTMSSSYSISNDELVSSDQSSHDHLGFYLGIYGGLAGANTLFTLLRAFLYAYGGIQAAKVLHKKLLSAILKAPVWFFDITPVGRIINRFSSDLYAIDDSLPFIMNILLAQLYGLFGTLVVTCYGLPWFMVLLVPLAIIYYYIQKYYRRTSRELKRLSTVTLSPVYAHFQETLTGLSTIRAMRATYRFMKENEQRLEMNQRANYGSYAIAQWLSIRLQMLGVAMVGGVAFIAVMEHHFAGSVNPGLVGLAISYALSVTNLLSGVVTSFTETEKEMVSVERAMQYIKGAPAERTGGHDPLQPLDPEWPSRGVIEFRKVVLRYREGLPPALKDVSLITKSAEKIGVVGRTGAGKSSLFQALFRIVDPLTSGTILIDGIDIATLPLENLRSVMAIIPQDPFLFDGSVRENLDPFNKCSDFELWSALERCHLRIAVQNMGGLDSEVMEKGRAFSVGQRQLVCLVRALLRQAKVICVDEATASVDFNTDAQIQQTIRTEFVTSTVITIAHRIETVLNCDRILVMDGGKVREFDSPGVLLGDPNSLFSLLYNEHTSRGRR